MEELPLDPAKAIARGKSRLVFEHPRHSDRLVKVMRPGYAERMLARRRPFSLAGQFAGNRVAAKELVHFLALEARHPELLRFLPWFHGFVATTLGLGVVCERISDDAGGLAPNLKALAAAGALTAHHSRLARELCDELARGRIVFNNMTPANIVAEGPRTAPHRLVIIDGFGDPDVPPLRRLSPWYNRLRQRGTLACLRAALGLDGPAAPRPHARGPAQAATPSDRIRQSSLDVGRATRR